MEKRLLSVRELSEYIGLSPQTIYNKINRGNFPIPYKKVFGLLKWEREEVDDFLNKLALQGGNAGGTRKKS
jgi:predicted DNA-binding transcriptional regulator AlpA